MLFVAWSLLLLWHPAAALLVGSAFLIKAILSH